MKRLLIYTSLLLAVGFGFTSCYKDIIKPELGSDPDGPPQPVSYKGELAAVFNTNCAVAGCHVTGAHKPYLTSDISYLQIVNGGFVNVALPKQSILYQQIYGEMGQYMKSAEDKQKVYDWIRKGAPNN